MKQKMKEEELWGYLKSLCTPLPQTSNVTKGTKHLFDLINWGQNGTNIEIWMMRAHETRHQNTTHLSKDNWHNLW